MDTQLFCMQPPKKAMLCETKIISGIIAACIGARHVLHIPTKLQHVLLPSPTTPIWSALGTYPSGRPRL